MKYFKLLFLVLFFCLFFTLNTYARDTDLYVGGGPGIRPNILIIFDNSGSMDWTIDTGNHYDPSTHYPVDPDHTDIVSTPGQGKVYKKRSSGEWFPLDPFKNSINGVGCPEARTKLTDNGFYFGKANYNQNTGECTGAQVTLATGNWLNFFLASNGIYGAMKKIDIAKKVIKDFLGTIQDVRIGLMVFGSYHSEAVYGGQYLAQYGIYKFWDGGRILHYIKDIDEGSARTDLISAVDSIIPLTYTPVAEALYEAGLYFQGKESHFNWEWAEGKPCELGKTCYKVNYSSKMPIQYYCQKNYVIIMTDGISTQDRDDILRTTIGDRDGDRKEPPGAPEAWNDPCYDQDGSDYLDDVAKYLYETDLNSTLKDKQNVVTYTIGFTIDHDLLRRTAGVSFGKYSTAASGAALADSFTTILGEILDKTSSFVAPIVPVSRMERTTAGDSIYLALFKPTQSGMWSGNIKKYGVALADDKLKGIVLGDILDASGSKASDSNGEFYPSSKSYWTTSSSDGGKVEVGGVGEVLRTTPRNIYTLLPGHAQDEDDGPDSDTSFDLTNSWNAFTTGNSRLTTSKLNVSTTDEKNNLINFVRGIDAYDDNVNGDTTDKRDWMLGSFLHSRPFIIHYADRTVIYAGANDGMLHAFNDLDGKELWAFIPPGLLGRLKELHTETPGIFVDGSPKAYVSYHSDGITVNKAVLIFGLRRGGNYYYALDVTNPTVPKYLWRIYQGKGGYFNELAQTWSTPIIGKVAYGTGEKWVAIFGAGYDEDQDLDDPPADNIGRGVYMADVLSLSGSMVWGHSYAGGAHDMTYSIPSDVAKVDLDGDGRIDRLYVGDTGGRMWRFDIGDLNKNGNSDPNEWTGRMIFKSNPSDISDSNTRKLFYPPDVTLERQDGVDYEMLFFGTGDREDPTDEYNQDRIYAFKDKNVSGSKGESDLVNVTNFYDLTAEDQDNTLNDIKTKYGWYILLDKNAGEKCLSTPLVYYKTAYYTTFSPTHGASADLCFVGEGTASLYAVNYGTGEAVFNLDLTNDGGGTVKSKTDRSLVVGSAIPSGVVITVIGGKVTAYAGVGGGIYEPPLPIRRSLFPLHWKLIF